jgi:hypothetical protein
MALSAFPHYSHGFPGVCGENGGDTMDVVELTFRPEASRDD